MMTHHFVMTSSRIKNFKIDKFGDFSSDIDYNSRTDIFRDAISLIINQCDLQATEGSLRRTQSVRQPRSASKRSALVILTLSAVADFSYDIPFLYNLYLKINYLFHTMQFYSNYIVSSLTLITRS